MLYTDYKVITSHTLDLRFLAAMTGHDPRSLAKMASSILNIDFDKEGSVIVSDWNNDHLTKRQIYYASNNAVAAIEIFKKLAAVLSPR